MKKILAINETIFCLEEITKYLHDKPEDALVELRDIAAFIDSLIPFGDGHSKRVSEYSLRIGEKIGLDKKQLVYLETAGLLHDFGKIGMDESVLQKPGSLSDSEKRIMEDHVLRGYYILSIFPEIEKPLEAILTHHEHYDGSGYPNGLSGKSIPLNGRIIAIADAYDAITSERPYRQTRTTEEAIEEIKKCSGTQFDPDIVKVFIDVISEN